MDPRGERVGKNEALFREVNERIEQIAEGNEAEFLCECGDPACTSPIRLPLERYEAVRSHPDRFAVLPGHEIPDVESVVEDHGAYVVVEKHPGRPAELAAEYDPRSDGDAAG